MDVMQEPVTAPPDPDEESEKRHWSRELWFLLAIAAVLALMMKSLLIQAFFIPSGSMEKTLHGCPGCPGDRVLVNKLVYEFRDIHRGEIVVFNGKGTNFTAESTETPSGNGVRRVMQKIQSLIGFGGPGDKDFIKRVIGVPGDVVACCTDGKVTINGQPIEEPYVFLSDPEPGQMKFDPVTVPEGELFLMGDHRDGSSDSRFNGTVPADKVVGRAFAIFYPLPRMAVLRVPETFTREALVSPEPVRRHAPAVPDALGVVLPVLAPRLRRTA